MKTFITLSVLFITLLFVPADSKNAYDWMPLKAFDTLATTPELPYSVDSIHQWFDDLESPFSSHYPESFWQYSLSGRNFNIDTMFVDIYKIDTTWVVSDIDTMWNYGEDTTFVLDTTWHANYTLNMDVIDRTLIYGYNRTLSEIHFYIDTLGNCNIRWHMKDTPYKVFKQINKY
jgi:hypothetical protein